MRKLREATWKLSLMDRYPQGTKKSELDLKGWTLEFAYYGKDEIHQKGEWIEADIKREKYNLKTRKGNFFLELVDNKVKHIKYRRNPGFWDRDRY